MEHPAGTELLHRYYEALNRKDFSALSELFDPEIEWTEPSDPPEAGRWQGREAVVSHFEQGLSNWAEGSCLSERLIAAGDRIVSLEKVNVRLKDHEDWSRGQIAAVFTLRDGRIAQGRIFWERNDALRWVGLEPQDE